MLISMFTLPIHTEELLVALLFSISLESRKVADFIQSHWGFLIHLSVIYSQEKRGVFFAPRLGGQGGLTYACSCFKKDDLHSWL